jgi:hypothetical protein
MIGRAPQAPESARPYPPIPAVVLSGHLSRGFYNRQLFQQAQPLLFWGDIDRLLTPGSESQSFRSLLKNSHTARRYFNKTKTTPAFVIPKVRAALTDRSITRPRINGPLSVIRQ